MRRQGSQFTSFARTDGLNRIGTRIPMDCKGRGLGNPVFERLWRSLKHECVYLRAGETGSRAKAGVASWISLCNRQPPRVAHGGRTPPPPSPHQNQTPPPRQGAAWNPPQTTTTTGEGDRGEPQQHPHH